MRFGPLDDPAGPRGSADVPVLVKRDREPPQSGPGRSLRSRMQQPRGDKSAQHAPHKRVKGMKDHRRADVDARDAMMDLMPGPPQNVEIMHGAVRPISEE